MKRLVIVSLAAVAVVGLLSTACSSAAPAPTAVPAATAKPSGATAAPTASGQAAEPTKAPDAAARASDFPAKGKAITLVVPFAAGGSTDSSTRVMASMLEKEIGTAVQVVNKPGGTNQVAANELIASKPDGYNLMMVSIPSSLVTYLDPERKAAYGRKDFHPVAGAFADGLGVVVKADSPFKTAKDVVDAAKANPSKVSTSTAGILGLNHLGGVAWEQNAGMKLAYVHFDGGAPQMTALLGGHTDVGLISLGNVRSAFKNGTVRVLGIMDKQENELFPGVPTLESQGFKAYASLMYAVTGPAGLPKDAVDVLNSAIKKVTTSPEYKTKVNEIGMVPRYLDAEQAAAAWSDGESWAKPLLDIAKKQ